MEEVIINKVAWLPVQDRKVLFVRAKGKELFYNAGGKPEKGEGDIEALARELQEELGVKLLPRTLEYLATFRGPVEGKPHTFVQSRCYNAQCEGELVPSAEVEAFAWFTSADYERTTATGKLILDWLIERNLID